MPAALQLSYWERETYFEGLDLLIVGGGIVGLSAALHLKQRRPAMKILVVDRGTFLPYGASTRNAGFACFGSITELLDDLRVQSEEEVFRLVEQRYAGLRLLRETLGDQAMDYEPLGGYELFTPAEEALYGAARDHLTAFNRQLEQITGLKETYSVCDHRIPELGFAGVNHLLVNHGEGQLNTGRMMQALLQKVRNAGVEVLTGLGAERWEREGGSWRVCTGAAVEFRVPRILVTTNAFARQLLPELAVVPGRAQVLITQPIPQLRVKGSFHYDRGYYYFRNVGDRLLLGGGRHLDFKAEETYDFGLTPLVQERLENLLRDYILPGVPVQIEQRWSGIMGLGSVKKAIVQEVEEGIFCAVRMGGMGIAIGSLVGREAAELLL